MTKNILIGSAGSLSPDFNPDLFDFFVEGYYIKRNTNLQNKPTHQIGLYGSRKLPEWRNPLKDEFDYLSRILTCAPKADTLILATEFISSIPDRCYPKYNIEDLRQYIGYVKDINPNIKIMLSEYRPVFLYRWQYLKEIIKTLNKDKVLVDKVGIQLHLKEGLKADLVLGGAVPTILKILEPLRVAVSFNEVSVWHHNKSNWDSTHKVWQRVLDLASNTIVSEIVPWWLYRCDSLTPMPTFQHYKLSPFMEHYDKLDI